MVSNKSVVFKAVPTGLPKPGQDLVVEAKEFDLNQTLPAGGVIAKTLYASIDPYMRGRMRDASIKSYAPAFALNETIGSWTVSEIIKSDHPELKEGDIISAALPVAEYNVIPKQYIGDMSKSTGSYGTRKIPKEDGLDPKLYIGVLGMPGLTAYSSLYEIGKPKKGETIFVSAASGAVGQLVGQLAKREGLTVIGSVGSQEKLDYITKELKFDAGFNYKTESAADALKRLAPNGIDIYYENVGGEQLQAAVDALNNFGRIVVCGMVSQYNLTRDQKTALRNVDNIVTKRLTIRGFIVNDLDMGPPYAKDHLANVTKWIKDGSIKVQTSVTNGIDNFGEGFVGMLEGRNFGKAVVKIADA